MQQGERIIDFKEAIRCLNSLQSNAAYLNAAKFINGANNLKLFDTKKYLLRSGLTIEQIDSLSVIHVAGTKGKGSTCAFTEAVLREHGYRTGFFSSPHLITVRERFRIDGRPINEMDFTRHFWHVYNLLNQRKENDKDMPQYFKFLTILMFHVFLKANVDVAILEVGIGGEYDCTNVVNSTVCTGITSLSLDHTDLLGDTLEKIAYQKSGIFKPSAPAFTVFQPNDAMMVLQARALERKCTLSLIPALEDYPWKKRLPVLGICSVVQKENASLAIQLASAWMSKHSKTKRSTVLTSTENKYENEIIKSSNNEKHTNPEKDELRKTTLCFEKVATALESCKWPGRTQILKGKTIDFYVDGAHTDESMQCCAQWFQSVVEASSKKYLIFNSTGNRDSGKLLAHLKKLYFNKAFFVPNYAGTMNHKVDQDSLNFPIDKAMEKSQKHAELWGEDSSVLASSVFEALMLIKKDSENDSINNKERKQKVLVTGSLHLVGAFLSIVDPEFSMSTKW